MRRYRTLFPTYWTNENIVDLPGDTKLLGAYLLTSLHTNMIGCFRLPNAYVVDDLRIGSETVSRGLRNLSERGFVTHDSRRSWLLINNFLKWNPIENPNQGIAASKLVGEVPRNSSVYAPLIEILRVTSRNFPAGFIDGLGTLSEPFRNQEQEQDLEQEKNSSPNADALGGGLESLAIVEPAKVVPRFTVTDVEAIYQAYPRQIGKGDAIKAIEKALKGIDKPNPVQYLLAAVREFADSPAGKKGKFTPHPSTWFNAKQWLDEPSR
jgi:hypothetical protein